MQVNIIGGNIENMPFEDNAFDVVICNHTLEHVLNIQKAVSELKRITRTKLIVTVPKQRYYHYTLDEHINFFPEVSYLLKALEITDDKAGYKNIGGDWTVIIKVK
ncbi:MAG: class I SAM-dependent methyltransferase [Bacteroidales bacterium]|jgi:ubiquinone/menaquinone biosynthesis C-methylase UbiE|nr:class I SAM-dependent methyltransferase [Bacteroidales bacterium]